MSETIAYIRNTGFYGDSRATKEIIALCEAGHRVVAMGWDQDGLAEEKSRQSFAGYPVQLCFFGLRHTGSLGMRNIGKLLSWLRWVRRCLIARSEITAVHACNLDAVASILDVIRRRKLKFVYDIYDYYVDSHAIPAALSRAVEALEIRAINRADLTIICTEEREEQLRRARPRRLLVLHNSPDVPDCPAPCAPEYDYVYCGSLFSGRLLEEIFDAYPQNADLRVAVAGYGDYADRAKALAEQYPNFTWLGALPYRQVLETERCARVISALYDPAFRNHRLCAPNKFYEALALARPVIVCAGTGIDRVVEQRQVGVVIGYRAEEFYSALRALAADPERCARMGQRARQLYDEKYRWEIMRKRLQDAYAQLK